jgi:hypothetical protein
LVAAEAECAAAMGAVDIHDCLNVCIGGGGGGDGSLTVGMPGMAAAWIRMMVLWIRLTGFVFVSKMSQLTQNMMTNYRR